MVKQIFNQYRSYTFEKACLMVKYFLIIFLVHILVCYNMY